MPQLSGIQATSTILSQWPMVYALYMGKERKKMVVGRSPLDFLLGPYLRDDYGGVSPSLWLSLRGGNIFE